ncbi:MAG: alpha/beta fold hydrolase [Terrimicrobiaceae bacterium]|nr:alpha/beta fold hydrolase [Terrimicrobiaceae bacterium]
MPARLSRTKKQALGIGLGVAFAGALALAARYGLRRALRAPIPETLSPAIFARRLAQTCHGGMVYQVSGGGPAAVFLHGIYPGASSFEWSRVYPHFVLEREVLAPDLIGFGESERPVRPLDASEHAESLADFLLEACAGKPAALVASGQTCVLALLLASRHPERVSSIALVGPRLDARPPGWARPGLSLAARIPVLRGFLYDFFIAREPFLRTWLANFGFADSSLADEGVVRVLAACAQQSGAGNAALFALTGGLRADLASRAERVPHPATFFIRREEMLPGWVKKMPSASVIELPACGELAAIEAAEFLKQQLGSALAGLRSAS